MAPTLARPPFHREGWIYEEKADGWRIIAYKNSATPASSVGMPSTPPVAPPRSPPRARC